MPALSSRPAVREEPNDGDLVQRDQRLQIDLQNAQNSYNRHEITKDQFSAKLTELHDSEARLFRQVRAHHFSDMTAGSYFYRGRLKFPSPIDQARDRLKQSAP